jgi:hypothetical protein
LLERSARFKKVARYVRVVCLLGLATAFQAYQSQIHGTWQFQAWNMEEKALKVSEGTITRKSERPSF